MTHNCASILGWEGSYFDEEGLAVASWAGGGGSCSIGDSNSSTARERVKLNCEGVSSSILGGTYSDVTEIAVYVRGRITNKQFCINIGGGVILECEGNMMFYIEGGGLILECGGDMKFYIGGGLILECGGDMMFYIGGGGLILKCGWDMMFYIDGLILGCQGTQSGVGSCGGGGGVMSNMTMKTKTQFNIQISQHIK